MRTIYKGIASLTQTGLYTGAAQAIPQKMQSCKEKETTISIAQLPAEMNCPPLLIVRLQFLTEQREITDPSEKSKYFQTTDNVAIQSISALREASKEFFGELPDEWFIPGISCFVDEDSTITVYSFFTHQKGDIKGLTNGQADMQVNTIMEGSRKIVWTHAVNLRKITKDHARLTRLSELPKKVGLCIPRSKRDHGDFKLACIDYDRDKDAGTLVVKLYKSDSDPSISRLHSYKFNSRDGYFRITDAVLIDDVISKARITATSELGLVLEEPETSWDSNGFLKLTFKNIFRKADMKWEFFDDTWNSLKGRKGIYVIFSSDGSIIDIGSSADQGGGAWSRKKANDHQDAKYFAFWEFPDDLVSVDNETVFLRTIEHDLQAMDKLQKGALPIHNHIFAPVSSTMNTDELSVRYKTFRERFRLFLPKAPIPTTSKKSEQGSDEEPDSDSNKYETAKLKKSV